MIGVAAPSFSQRTQRAQTSSWQSSLSHNTLQSVAFNVTHMLSSSVFCQLASSAFCAQQFDLTRSSLLIRLMCAHSAHPAAAIKAEAARGAASATAVGNLLWDRERWVRSRLGTFRSPSQ